MPEGRLEECISSPKSSFEGRLPEPLEEDSSAPRGLEAYPQATRLEHFQSGGAELGGSSCPG